MFDVDKIFIAYKSYKNGVLEETDLSGDELVNASKGAIRNKLLLNYIDIVTDPKSFSNARASIDVITNILKNEVLSVIRKGDNKIKYAQSMYELTPQFLSRRKQEFSVGKNGIGPFALNITNLALTQYAHLTLNYGDDNMSTGFRFGDLDEIIGEDGMRISDWLSAMVNAHVDVAKDPYVFDLNINKATYNHANFLIRAGKGKTTFLFLAQKSLKEYANLVNSSGGMYGSNIEKNQETKSKNTILKELIKSYDKKFNDLYNSTEFSSEEEKLKWFKSYNNLKTNNVKWYTVFDVKSAEKAIENPDSLFGILFNIFALKAFDRMSSYAQQLSDLVRVSKVDTKKFGNDLTLHLNFLNSYNKFRSLENESNWKLKEDLLNNVKPLEHYFNSTFINTKLHTAIGLTRDLLRKQSYSATETYRVMFNTIMAELFGAETYFVEERSINGYEEVMDQDIVSAIGTAIENTIRTKMLFKYGDMFTVNDGVDMSSDSITWEQREKNNNYSGPIDFTFGGDVDEAVRQIKRLFLGDETSKSLYNQNSLFENMAALIERMRTNPDIKFRDRPDVKKYEGLVNSEGRILNELLNYLRPTVATEQHPIPRMLFSKSKIDTTVDERSILSSSFDFLLKHPNEGVRRLARDIALYAYYSTYDTSSASSFFDLVPYEYRKQYDNALAQGVENIDQYNQEVSATEMIDLICKNYYNDDNIVQLYLGDINKNSGKNDYKSQGTGEYFGKKIGTNIKGVKVPNVIITSKTNSKYIKIREQGLIFLYKKIKKYSSVDNFGAHDGSDWHGYIMVEKLGRHAGTTHQYEFVSNQTESMFEENRLPSGFVYSEAMKEFETFERVSNERLNKKDLKLNIIDLEDVNLLDNTYFNDSYKDVDKNVKYEEDQQIIISDQSVQEYSSHDINIEDSIEDILSMFGKESKEYISISFSGNTELNVTDATINDYVEEQISLYQGRINPQVSEEMRNKMISAYEEKVRNSAEENVRQRLLEEIVLNILSELDAYGVSIESAYVSLDNNLQKAAYKVLKDTDIVDADNLFVVSKEKVDDEQIENIMNDEQLVISDEEEADSLVVKEVIDNFVEMQQEAINESSEIEEKRNEDVIDVVEQSSEIDSLDNFDINTFNKMLGLPPILGESENNKDHEQC